MILPKKNFFSKHKIKAEFKCLDDSEVLSSDFPGLKPLQPQWPQWPQQPQWLQWPKQQPHFIKKFTDPDDFIIRSTQMTNISPFLWNASSKIQFFTDIWHSFCLRLLRPASVIFLKYKCPNLLKPLGTMIQKISELSIPQSHSVSLISLWDTLYFLLLF